MLERCCHCNEPIPEQVSINAGNTDNPLLFCCHGCQLVYEWIQSEGLNQYYQVRDSAPRVGNLNLEAYQHYDLSGIYQKYVHFRKLIARPENQPNDALESGVEQDRQRDTKRLAQVDLLVEGIHCSACIWLIDKALHRLPGITQVDANASSLLIRVMWHDGDTEQTSKLSHILSSIARLGYTPSLSRADAQHEHTHKMRREALKRLVVSGLFMMQVMMYSTGLYAGAFYGMDAGSRTLLSGISFLGASVVYFYCGRVFIASAWRALKAGVANMDLPVAIATSLAYFASVYHLIIQQGEIYFDSVVMFIFFLSAGRYIEMMSRFRSTLKTLQKPQLLPEFVLRRDYFATSSFETVSSTKSSGTNLTSESFSESVTTLDNLALGDEIVIFPGEVFAVDGEIISGCTQVNEATLTGESNGISKQLGDTVFAGTLNLEQKVVVRISALYHDTALAEVMTLLNKNQQHQPKLAQFADQIAKHVVWFILGSALTSYLVWAIFIDAGAAFSVALAVLIATCPCALSLAAPTVFATTAHHLASLSLYVKTNKVYDLLGKVVCILFDKTGTLTQDRMQLAHTRLAPNTTLTKAQVLNKAATLERHIHHPVARAFLPYDNGAQQVNDLVMHPNQGVAGTIAGKAYFLGKASALAEHGYRHLDLGKDHATDNGQLLLIENGEWIAEFTLVENENTYAAEALRGLRALSAKSTAFSSSPLQLVVLSGDAQQRVTACASALGIDTFYAEQRPADKLAVLHQYQQQLRAPVMMVGDGINDAPVLSQADIAVAVGNASALSRSEADIVLAGSDLRQIVRLMQVVRKSQSIMYQNLVWAFCYNALAIPLAITGHLPPWLAAIGMSLSSVLVVLNALRIYRS